MLDPDSIDRAKQACLKQSFGAELTAEEHGLLDQFLASAAGQQYREDSSEMKRRLAELAVVDVRVPMDSAAMLTSFESMAREELRAAQRQLPLALLLTSGIGLLTGGLCLQSGQENKVFFGWTMLGFAALCGILFAAIWSKTRAWLEDPELLLRMEEERAAGESKLAVRVAAVIGVVLLAILAVGVANAGGVRALAIAAVVNVVVFVIGRVYLKRKRAKNQELWDWWDGQVSEG